jgi:hypothetical protein
MDGIWRSEWTTWWSEVWAEAELSSSALRMQQPISSNLDSHRDAL